MPPQWIFFLYPKAEGEQSFNSLLPCSTNQVHALACGHSRPIVFCREILWQCILQEFYLQVPLILPIFMIFVSLFLVIGPFIDKVRVEYLVSIAVLIVLAILYYPFIYKGYRIPGMGMFNISVLCRNFFFVMVSSLQK